MGFGSSSHLDYGKGFYESFSFSSGLWEQPEGWTRSITEVLQCERDEERLIVEIQPIWNTGWVPHQGSLCLRLLTVFCTHCSIIIRAMGNG